MATWPLSHDTIFRPGEAPAAAQPDAVAAAAARTPGHAGAELVGVCPAPPARGTPGPALPRDRAVLLRLARLRVLSLAELQALVFRGRDRSRLSARLGRLEQAGWLRRWEEPRERGGRFRLVVPTAKGLAWALHRLDAGLEGSADARLVRTMLSARRTAPLVLPAGRIPASLPHLRDVNALLVAALLAEPLRVTWASSWPRALPTTGPLRPPAPDGVLVLAPIDGPRELVFLEHDRATESLRTVARTKLERYRALAAKPATLEERIGFRRFRVVVTVGGEPSAVPARVQTLRRTVRLHFAEGLVQVVPAAEVLAGADRALRVEGRGVPPDRRREAPGALAR